MSVIFKGWLISWSRRNSWVLSPKGKWRFKILKLTKFSKKYILRFEIYFFVNKANLNIPPMPPSNPYLDGSEPIDDLPKPIKINLGLVKIDYRPLTNKNVSN